MRMRWLDGLVLFYGILLIALGFYAYLVAHHLPSLIAGGSCGILEIGFAALATTNPRVGRIGSAVLALMIFGMFFNSWLTEGGKIDFFILWVSSLIVFACLMGGHFYAMNQRKKAATAAPEAPAAN